MQKNRIIRNIFSNWTNLFVSILVSFIVTPITINSLGPETYGVWVLIVTLTSYFTVLDFGVNGAIVRYISKYEAVKDYLKASSIYSTSFAFFLAIALIIVVFCLIFAIFFKSIFTIDNFESSYLYWVFLFVGLDLALNLIFGVFVGSLKGIGRFLELNIISICTNITKNIVIVILLLNDFSILAIAVTQLSTNCLKFLFEYLYLTKFAPFLSFKLGQITSSSFKTIYNYSLYIFIIAVAMKLLFYTDSIIIGIYLETEQVTFYAIPTMILQYLEQFVWAFIAVLLPIISGLEALGNKKANSSIYQLGTKYALLGCSPIFLVLFVAGDDFIGLWMGAEYKEQSGEVMHILLIGYIFFLAQLTAHGILKGLSKHKILAVLLSAEALFNLGLSQYLAPIYGINGVAMGTVIPLIVINVFLLPLFTCRQLKINYFNYIARSYLVPLGSLFLFLVLLTIIDFRVDTFLDLIILSLLTLVIFYAYCFFIHLDQELKIKIINIYLKIRFADRAKNEK